MERLERGHIRPTSALLHALAVALTVPPGYAPRPAQTAELEARLVDLTGPSLVPSTPGGARRRRRRLRKARLAANRVAVPQIRAALAGQRLLTQELMTRSAAMVARADRLLP